MWFYFTKQFSKCQLQNSKHIFNYEATYLCFFVIKHLKNINVLPFLMRNHNPIQQRISLININVR
jgi:hypothetical protein